MEDAGCEGAGPEPEEHVPELADGGVGEDALYVVLDEGDGGGEDGGNGADGGYDGEGRRSELVEAVGAGDHVDAGGDHGGGVDEGGYGGGAFHRVGQPDVQGHLGGLA